MTGLSATGLSATGISAMIEVKKIRTVLVEFGSCGFERFYSMFGIGLSFSR